MTPEGRVKAKVGRALDKLGPEAWRFMPVQTGFGAAALDYLICYRGRFIAIETKAAKKKLTPRQTVTAQRIANAGGLVIIIEGEEGAKAFVGSVLPALKEGYSDELVPWTNDCWRFLCKESATVPRVSR